MLPVVFNRLSLLSVASAGVKPTEAPTGMACLEPDTGNIYRFNGTTWAFEFHLVINTDLANVWPVGSIFLSVLATNPVTLLGFGTWVQIAQGQFLVGQKTGDPDFATAEATGGNKTHTHAAHPAMSHTGALIASAVTGITIAAHSALTHIGAAIANAITGITIGVSGAGSSHNHSVSTPTGAGASHNHAITQASFTTTKFTTNSSGSAAYTGGGNVTTPSGAESVHTHAVSSPTGNESAHTHASGTITEPNSGTGHTHGFTEPGDHTISAHSISDGGHSHSFTEPNDHAAQSHDSPSHLPPFEVIYAWKRTQ